MKKHPAIILMTAAFFGAGLTSAAQAQRSYRASINAGTQLPKQQTPQPLFPGYVRRSVGSAAGTGAPSPDKAEQALREKLARQEKLKEQTQQMMDRLRKIIDKYNEGAKGSSTDISAGR